MYATVVQNGQPVVRIERVVKWHTCCGRCFCLLAESSVEQPCVHQKLNPKLEHKHSTRSCKFIFSLFMLANITKGRESIHASMANL